MELASIIKIIQFTTALLKLYKTSGELRKKGNKAAKKNNYSLEPIKTSLMFNSKIWYSLIICIIYLACGLLIYHVSQNSSNIHRMFYTIGLGAIFIGLSILLYKYFSTTRNIKLLIRIDDYIFMNEYRNQYLVLLHYMNKNDYDMVDIEFLKKNIGRFYLLLKQYSENENDKNKFNFEELKIPQTNNDANKINRDEIMEIKRMFADYLAKLKREIELLKETHYYYKKHSLDLILK